MERPANRDRRSRLGRRTTRSGATLVNRGPGAHRSHRITGQRCTRWPMPGGRQRARVRRSESWRPLEKLVQEDRRAALRLADLRRSDRRFTWTITKDLPPARGIYERRGCGQLVEAVQLADAPQSGDPDWHHRTAQVRGRTDAEQRSVPSPYGGGLGAIRAHGMGTFPRKRGQGDYVGVGTERQNWGRNGD